MLYTPRVCSFFRSRTDKIALLGSDRVVEPTEKARAKSDAIGEGSVQEDESIFSAHLFPVDFYRDMLKGQLQRGASRPHLIVYRFVL